TDVNQSVGGHYKRIHLNDPGMNVTIIGNFDIVDQSDNANFQHSGIWYDYFSGDSIDVSDPSASINLAPGEFHIYSDVKLTQPDVALSNEDLLTHPLKLTAYPNPFAEDLLIEFSLPKSDVVKVEVLNSMGQLVRVLTFGERFSTQANQLIWDGTNAAGHQLSEGIYFIKLQTQSGIVDTQRILLQK
ncbi:MAG: FlgD immunoglobulin-like domain containing protein, partial [Bacteroidota bacterium]